MLLQLLLQAICIVQLICIAMNCASQAGMLQLHGARPAERTLCPPPPNRWLARQPARFR